LRFRTTRARSPDWTIATLRTSPCGSSSEFLPTRLSVPVKSKAMRGGLETEKPIGAVVGGFFIPMRR
jgi:hypothetical protein